MSRPAAAAQSRPFSLPQLLVGEGMLSREEAARVREVAQRDKAPVWQVLVQEGLVSSRDLAAITAMRLGLSMVSLRNSTIDREAVALVPEDVARSYVVLPVERNEDSITVAVVDPTDLGVMHDLTARIGVAVEPVVATSEDILEHIEIAYRLSAGLADATATAPLDRSPTGRLTASALRSARPTELIDLLLRQALQDRASDIHIEATERHLRVRFRIDGILHDVMQLPLESQPPLISRLKIMAGMNIAERRRAQDGQFVFEVEGRNVDVRLAVASTVNGEMAVLRLLDKEFTPMGLDQLGMSEAVLERYRRLLGVPNGMIVVCGPTGSGKSTTLYASTLRMNRSELNVVSLEDPVEYHIADANQMQVHPHAGITFATQLRSILRLDPDVILVGEIRDEETAVVAIQAALTGHLVLTSLHANDSVAALLRLRDLGVPPYLIASSVAGIVAQRMVRVICSGCRTASARPLAEQQAYADELGETRERFLTGSGCNVCAQTGYRGRTGVFEVLSMTDAVRQRFLADEPRRSLWDQALADGMTPLKRDGMLKVRDGITTPYEVIRVLFTLD